MGQFDLPTEAALTWIQSDELLSSPVAEIVQKVSNIGGIILEVIGFTGASAGIEFINSLKKDAANKDESNLIYFGNALLDDIRRLYRLCAELKSSFDERIQSPEFSAIVANATLHITRTNVESRLKRLAHIITNGVKEGDLEPESLDDMMRAAVELTENDILVLKEIYNMQIHLFSQCKMEKEYFWRENAIREQWESFWKSERFADYQGSKGMAFNSSFTRLQSAGLIASIGPKQSVRGPTKNDYELLLEGTKLYERLQEIAAE